MIQIVAFSIRDTTILEAFLGNPVGLPVEKADSARSEGVDC